MKVVTINLPETYIDAIARLCGDEYESQYASRSEFVRLAVRHQLLIDLELMKKFSHPEKIKDKKMIQDKKIMGIKSVKIKVPIARAEEEKKILEEKQKDLERLRELYPKVPDFKFIGEA